jgi:hypothetical protein
MGEYGDAGLPWKRSRRAPVDGAKGEALNAGREGRFALADAEAGREAVDGRETLVTVPGVDDADRRAVGRGTGV